MANCKKCNDLIADRRSMSCSICKKHFHLACANVSSPRFYLMSPSRKQTWKCEDCREGMIIHNKDEEILNTSPNFVTQRKYRVNISTYNSFESLSDGDSSNLSTINEKLNRSCPEVQISHGEQTEELKEKNFKLQLELESADEEIKNLLSENYALKNRITKLESLNKTLTQICSSTKRVSSNIKRNSLKKRVLEFSNIDNSIIEQVENRQNDLDTNVVKSLNPSNKDSKVQETKTYADYTATNNNKETKTNKATNNDYQRGKRKLCVLSSNSTIRVLQLIRSTLDHTDICHYITPGAGISQLLKGIENKLCDFDYDDYCILFIGDADFKETYKYSELIEYIRNKLQNVQHTNIVICLPTYRSANYSNLYNKRVEIFNNLLYRDNKNYEYAYLLDSNKKMEYATKMYTRGGFVSNYGYKIIIENLNELISDISHYYYYLYSLKEPIFNEPTTIIPHSLNLSCPCQSNCFFR